MAEKSNKVRYAGTRKVGGCEIKRIDPDGTTEVISPAPSLKLWNHSPDGFEWGYYGSGPAQTALALLLDWTGDEERAVTLHQDFKHDVISRFQGDLWQLTGQQISDAISAILAKRLASSPAER